LLAKLRQYEALLKEHRIQFEPLHPNQGSDAKIKETETFDSRNDSTPSTADQDASPAAEGGYEPKSFWSAMNAGFRDGDDDDSDDYDSMHYDAVKKTWDQVHAYTDQLFFGSGNGDLDLSPLHPSSIQMIRLFQIYLDNVNAILKLTHAPSIQGQVIEAASNPASMSRELEALMFAIYCMAIASLTNAQCLSIFDSTKDNIFNGYRFGCQQALAKCEFLRTRSRDCLTALYLYLVCAPVFN